MFKLTNFLEARNHANKIKAKNHEHTPEGKNEDYGIVDRKIYNYFFDLQSKIEKEAYQNKKGFNYYDYADQLWKEVIIDKDPDPNKLEIFKNLLVKELHEIDMKDHVYPDVIKNILELQAKYGDKVKHISLWSTGDTTTTGYQAGKISSSRIFQEYIEALNKLKTDKQERKDYLDNKTSYMVDDDKFTRLVNFVETIKTNTNPIKLVVIEDSRGNFEKIKKALESKFSQEELKNIKIIPIWATYSREGEKALEKTKGDEIEKDKLNKEKIELNAIDNFSELKDAKFEEIFTDAYVFVDFDGVIGNNITMREEQAKAIYSSLITSLKDEENSEEKIKKQILEKLTNL